MSEAEAQILGTDLATFGVLAGSTVTNTGPSVIQGNLGVSPGSAVTGFPPGIVVAPGTIHAGDALAGLAQTEWTTAYNTLAGMAVTQTLTGQDLGGKTLIAGVYGFANSAQLTGLLTLNGQGNSASQFVFQIGTTLTTASNSAVLLINGANGNNVYWAVGSSATLGTNTAFAGNILASASITLNTGATITCGRALASTAAVTLDTNTITLCASGGGGGGGGSTTTTQLFGGGVSGAQQTAFGASRLFGNAMIGQALYWTIGGPDTNAITPLSLKDAGGLKDGGGYAPDGHGYRAWVAGLGETGSFRRDAATNLGNLDARTGGFAAGFDYSFDPTALMGIAAGYTNSTYSANQLQTDGTVEGVHVGLYGAKTFGPAYFMGTAQYAHYYNENARTIQWVTMNEQATGKFQSDGFGGRLEAGWRQPFGGYNVTPFAGVDGAYLNSNGFTENSLSLSNGSPGLLGLTYNPNSATSLRSSVGLQLDTRIANFNQTLVPFVRAAWVHEFNPNVNVNSHLTLSPLASSSIEGFGFPGDAAKIDAGIKLDVTDSIALIAQFDGEFSGQGQSYGGNGVIRIRW